MGSGLGQREASRVIEQIETENFEVVEVLKDHPRSKVCRIRLEGNDLVLKIPREKNKKYWIRFLTLFRKSEVFKNFLSMQFLNSSGFKTTKGYLACEYRKWGMVMHSWLLYHYLDGVDCLDREEMFQPVVQLLRAMHSKNILHGDSQIRNFITSGPNLYIIDANPKKSKSAFAKAYELAYLKRSQPEIEPLVKVGKYYDLAVRFDTFDRKLALLRRSIKRIVGLRK